MQLSPDSVIYFHLGPFAINATLVFSWLVMAILTIGSWLVTRNLSTGSKISRWQNLLEAIVSLIRDQIAEITRQDPRPYLSFVGTLFLFILLANFLTIFPGYQAPTASLSTTAALALCVFVAVPIFGIAGRGVLGYLKNYLEPTPLMLPFNIISELSRTLALAVRLFGNIMSGQILIAIVVSFLPLILPALMQLFGLVIGLIQAYIFAVLATVYIAAATRE